MSKPPAADEEVMRLRYAGTCRVCAAELPAKTEAVYERTSKTVRCVGCSAVAADPSIQQPLVLPAPPEAASPGVPGASARRKFDQLHARREEQIRAEHPRLGGLIIRLSDDPQSTRAWDTGAVGEERLGARLNELCGETLRVLHDRRIPGTRANIDHLAVTPTGVYVVDAKRYHGRPTLVLEGGLLRPRVEKLVVAGRDRSKLIDGILGQVDVVRGVVGDDVPIHGVLCFVEADWPLIGGSFTTRGVDVLWPKKLYRQLLAVGPLEVTSIVRSHHALAEALPSA